MRLALASSGGAGARFDGMAVSWTTGLPAGGAPTVYYSAQPGVVAGGVGVTAVPAERTTHLLASYHHHAVITGLAPRTKIFFRVGNSTVRDESSTRVAKFYYCSTRVVLE